MVVFTRPFVLCDRIFELRGPLAPNEQGGVLQPEEAASLYSRDHSSPTLYTWNRSYTSQVSSVFIVLFTGPSVFCDGIF